MAVFTIILQNISDAADPGKTIVQYLETNIAAILAQNVSTQVNMQRTS